MDPRQFLRILLARWPIIAVLVVLGGVLGWVTAPDAQASTTPRQELTLWQATNIQFMRSNAPGGLTPSQIRFFATFEDEVPQRVAERIDGDPAQLASQVSLEFDSEIGLLRVSSTNADPERAAELADTFAEELRLWLEDRAASNQAERRDVVLTRIDSLEQQIRDLDGRIAVAGGTDETLLRAERDSLVNQLRLERERFQAIAAEGAPSAGLQPAREARPVPISGPAYYEQLLERTGVAPGSDDADASGGDRDRDSDAGSDADGSGLPADFPVQPVPAQADAPGRVTRAAIGSSAGLVLGLAIVAGLARFDRRIRTRIDAEAAFGLPVLTEIPPLRRHDRSEILAWARPRSNGAEAHRALRTALALPTGPRPLGERRPVDGEARDLDVVMVTSPDPGDGKSTTVANLAAVLAEAGQRVLVIDCDFRKPRMAELLGADDVPAFGDQPAHVLRDEAGAFCAPTAIDGVWFARTVVDGTDAEERPAAALASQRRMVQALRADYDAILLDTAPLRSTNDAADLLPVTDGVLFVARTGRTRIPDAELVTERFERLGAPMLGVALLGSTGGDGRGRYATYYQPVATPSRWPGPGRAARVAE